MELEKKKKEGKGLKLWNLLVNPSKVQSGCFP